MQLGYLISVNVYSPCPEANKWDDEYVNCPALIANKLCELDYKNLIYGGDLNTDFAWFHPMRSCIMGLRLTDELLPPLKNRLWSYGLTVLYKSDYYYYYYYYYYYRLTV